MLSDYRDLLLNALVAERDRLNAAIEEVKAGKLYTPAARLKPGPKPGRKKRELSPEAREAISQAQKARWAAKRDGNGESSPAPQEPAAEAAPEPLVDTNSPSKRKGKTRSTSK